MLHDRRCHLALSDYVSRVLKNTVNPEIDVTPSGADANAIGSAVWPGQISRGLTVEMLCILL
jgi:hypothetical protein